MNTSTLKPVADAALQAMRDAGFEHAQVTANRTRLTELNINHSAASLLRSTESFKTHLMGISGGRMASTELASHDAATIAAAAQQLFADAQAAPADPAYAVSSGQQAQYEAGPLEPDLDALATKTQELLDFRAQQTPKVILEEGIVSHRRSAWQTLTTGGSDLSGEVGSYDLSVMFSAKDGTASSSFNYTGGSAHAFHLPAPEMFGVGRLLREAEQQIHTQAASAVFGEKFVGDVVLTPSAVADLMSWLLAQLSDSQLIAGTSLYRQRVGDTVASPQLTVRSRFDAPGCVPQSGDAFVTPSVTLIEHGQLRTLTPSLYGSRKLGLPHHPVTSGWEVQAGDAPLAQLVGAVSRGAVVGRLSMGAPAANGDFAGVIKNSFAIQNGQSTAALGETMISGNMAQMLLAIEGVSAERLDSGAWCLPWLRIGGLHFS